MDKTERGFGKIEFIDKYDKKCSLQESSLATDDCIWLGIDDPEPKRMEPNKGWFPFHIPEDVLISTRMHLNKEQVKELLPYLQKFVETGFLRENE